MLVYECFAGDDLALARAQHDAYRRALGLLIDGCRRHYLNACATVGVAPDRWPADLAIDHRHVQDTRDLVAATWRWRVAPPQRSLALDPTPRPTADAAAWLRWLADEVHAWRDAPGMVLNAIAMLTHPYGAVRYAGELRLRRDLLARYADVPWREEVRNREGD